MHNTLECRARAWMARTVLAFALVPALVVAFSVVQAFTGTERVADRVHEFLFESLAVGAQSTIGPYLDRFIEFEHFFIRKVMLVKYSSAFIIMPGGFGTLDEAFEVITLIQTNKLERFPVVIMGGLITATLLNLFVVPVLYLAFGKSLRGAAELPEAPA